MVGSCKHLAVSSWNANPLINGESCPKWNYVKLEPLRILGREKDAMTHHNQRTEIRGNRLIWLTRIVVGIVFLANINASFAFILKPSLYAPDFEVEGVAGRAIVQGIGILFLMWNVTYPLVIFQPIRYMTLFGIILVQQAIGVVGETWLWLSIPPGHTALRATGWRFIVFDGGGLLLMGLAYLILWKGRRR